MSNNKVTAIIERTTANRRKEEGPRIHLHLSFPIRGNGELALLLQEQIANPIEVEFDPIQARLTDPPAAVEQTRMSVNGADGQTVRRPRKAAPTDGLANGPSPHPFEAATDNPDKCAACGYHREAEVHVSEAAAALIEESRLTPATEKEAQAQKEAEARLAGAHA